MHANPAYLAVPPPFELELIDESRRVGWVRGDRVAFRGFRDEAEAAHAAWAAHRAMVQRIVVGFGARSAPAEVDRLLIARQRGEEVVFADGRYIATLHVPGASQWVGEEHYAIEMRVPPPNDEVTMRATADALYRALRESGARWALFDADLPGEAKPALRSTLTAQSDRGVPESQVGPGARLVVVAALAVLVALLQPLVAPDAPIRIPLLGVAAAAVGAAGISEVMRRVR